MSWDQTMFLAVLTWPACAAIIFIATCRLNAMPKNTLFLVVLEYSIWAAIGVGAPLLPLIGDWPGVGSVALMYGLLAILLCSARAWAGDIAPDEATDNAPLEEFPRTWRMRVLVAWERLKDRFEWVLERRKEKK